MRAFIEQVARLTKDQECETCRSREDTNPECKAHELFDMPSDDAVEALCNLISQARGMVAPEPEQQSCNRCDKPIPLGKDESTPSGSMHKRCAATYERQRERGEVV